MGDFTHFGKKYINPYLNHILGNMNRQLLILLGAGASKPFNIPTMVDMVEDFERTLFGEEFSKWREVKHALQEAGIKPDLEAMLSVLTVPKIDASKLDPQVAYYLKSHLPFPLHKNIEVLNSSFAKSLEEKIKQYIWNACNLEKDPEKRKEQVDRIYNVYNRLFMILASKLGRSESESGLKSILSSGSLDIYTTNYDRCIEVYFDQANRKIDNRIQLDEGLQGKYWSPLNYKSADTNFNRIFKLHGSIQRYWTNLGIRDSDQYLKEGEMIDGDAVVKRMMIWPLREKPIYQHPFSFMFNQFYYHLRCGTPLIIIGHSLRDVAILDILLSVADEIRERRMRGEERNFRILLMNPDAEKIIDREEMEQIRNLITTVPYEFGTERGFQELSTTLKKF